MKDQIYIQAFDYLENQEARSIWKSDVGLLLIVSTMDDTKLIVDQQCIRLNKYQTIVYQCGEEEISKVSGQAMFVVLSGRLILQYNWEGKIGTVIPFFASNSLAGRIRHLQTMLDHENQPDDKELIELGFGLLLDIWAYKISEIHMPKVVSDAIEIIDDDYGRLYGVDDLADRVGVSKNHLIRQFREEMETTPGAYLEARRIEMAKTLLTSSDFDLETIANLCGYSCANYFGKVFKRRMNTSPLVYAKRNTGSDTTDLSDEIYF